MGTAERYATEAEGHVAVVLGTNEIASAVAVHLHRAGYAVVLSHDPHPPVIRRRMAFHDVLFGERGVVEGIEGIYAETGCPGAAMGEQSGFVTVTRLDPPALLAATWPALLVDARMQKRKAKADLRPLAQMTVGLGPGFHVGLNCDIAVETRPPRNGDIVRVGRTDLADGISARLGDAGGERFVYAPVAGYFHARHDIGDAVVAGAPLGDIDGTPVHAPLTGILRGIVRDGTDIPAGVKLIEIDPRGAQAQWTGIDARGRTIAQATLTATRIHAARRLTPAAAAL